MMNDSIPPMQKPTTPIPLPVDAVEAREVVDRAAHVAPGAVRRQALHQLAGFVHLVMTGELAVIEVGRERDEAGGRETIGHLLDAAVETPPFLDHEDPWS